MPETPLNLDQARAELATLAASVAETPGRIRLENDRIVLDNPAAKGAVTAQMMVQLADVVATLADDGPSVVTLEGSGPGVFCSGGHLGQVKASLLADGNGLRMARCMTAVLDALAQLPCVVVARVDGPALGGGAELLTACDAVFVGAAARIGFVHGRLGVAPGWGGAARLVRSAGPARALDILARAAVMDAEASIRVGLARGDLDAGRSHLEALRRTPAVAVRAMKRQVVAASPIVRTGAEAEIFASVWGSALHRERLGL